MYKLSVTAQDGIMLSGLEKSNGATFSSNERGIASMKDSRTSMSLCIPRGLLLTLRVGLEKDKEQPQQMKWTFVEE